ncbi:MAG: hypothetical protein ABSC56_11725 [Solirubrobacteraceae bacterium]
MGLSSRRWGLRARLGLALGLACALAASATAAAATPSANVTYIKAPASSSASPELWLARANGADAHGLGPASTAVLSPNGAFVAAVGPGKGSPAQGSSLVLYALSSKKTRTLRSSAAQLTILGWSPDDHWIAVTDGNSLVVVPLRGPARTLATGTIVGASFAPHAPDRLVFGKAVGAQVNLFTQQVPSGAPNQITHDGLSEYPLWGPKGIIFSHEESSSSTTLQLWLRSGGHDQQLTNMSFSGSVDGLEPVAVSADGQHLLANLVGDNTSQAWCIDLADYPISERAIGSATTTTIGNAISRGGTEVLVTEGAGTLSGDDFSQGTVDVVPWAGGSTTTLAQHSAFASWDR